ALLEHLALVSGFADVRCEEQRDAFEAPQQVTARPVKIWCRRVDGVWRKTPAAAWVLNFPEPRFRRSDPIAPRALPGKVTHFQTRPDAKFRRMKLRSKRPPTDDVADAGRPRLQQHLHTAPGRLLVVTLLPPFLLHNDLLEPIGKVVPARDTPHHV